jgi:phage terminase large subunit-like protein
MTRPAPEPEPEPDFAAELLARTLRLPPGWREKMLEGLGQDEATAFDSAWRAWAHRGQRPPDAAADGSDWCTWVIMAGRGFGKTRAGSEWVLDAVKRSVVPGEGRALRPAPGYAGRPLRIALVAATLDEARRIMVEGESGLLAVADAWISRWEPTRRILRFRGGAEAHLFSGASPEQLRGPQHHFAWCDELAKWEKAGEAWDMLQLGLRLGEWPRTLVTTTPRPGPVLRRIMDARGTIVTGGPTRANPHLPEAFIDNVEGQFAGTRLARQELEGELLTDNPGALWSEELLEACRLKPSPSRGEGRLAEGERGEGTRYVRGAETGPHPPTAPLRAPPASGEDSPRLSSARPGDGRPDAPLQGEGVIAFTRLVIAVDPPSGDGTCGIVACAKDKAGQAHVLADHSVTARTPEGWSRTVAEAASLWGRLYPNVPVEVAAEQNQGGLMVRSVLRIADPAMRVKLVTATQGKADRAAPVAMLFEAGKVTLHGRFPELEAQLCGMIGGGGYEPPASAGRERGASPDRADAMVWALTELMLGRERGEPRVRRL